MIPIAGGTATDVPTSEAPTTAPTATEAPTTADPTEPPTGGNTVEINDI